MFTTVRLLPSILGISLELDLGLPLRVEQKDTITVKQMLFAKPSVLGVSYNNRKSHLEVSLKDIMTLLL